MRVVIAPDSFKGSLSSISVADAVAKGVLTVFPEAEIIKIPVADGGEGLLEAIHKVSGGKWVFVNVKGPIEGDVSAKFLMLEDEVAVLEMAQASGLPLVSAEKKDPRIATTYGTGEMLKAALDHGAKKIIIGIGGSATNDGGAGMAQALGVSLKDKNGVELPVGGAALMQIASIDISGIDKRIYDTQFVAACDISNPLCGEKGASAVYGPQKGATPEIVRQLDRALSHFADQVKADMKMDVQNIEGAGAAGGLGFGLMVFCAAKLQPGIEIVLDITKIDSFLHGADLCITGEGRVDFQSAFGKVPDGVARHAKKFGVPVMVIAGSIGTGAEELYDRGVVSMSAIQHKPMTLQECMDEAPALLESSAERMMRAVKLGMEIKEKK